jgi:hypothetical protein
VSCVSRIPARGSEGAFELREGDAVKDSQGVEIEVKYRHTALLAAAEELRAAAALVERVAWASVGQGAR